MELIYHPLFIVGVLFGAVTTGLSIFFSGMISAWSGKSEKPNEHQNTLMRKLQEAGYTVYTPVVMSDQLSTSLTPEEMGELCMARLVIFDEQGNSVTGLSPNTSQSVLNDSGYRNGRFPVLRKKRKISM